MHSEDKKVEEILSSIRNIISEDIKDHASPNFPSATHPARAQKTNDPVIELTQMVEKDGSIVNLSSPKPQATSSNVAPQEPRSSQREEIISSAAAHEFANAFSNLENTLKAPLSSAPQLPTFDKNNVGQMTLEMIVNQMLQPLLKEWLDKHLPSLVKLLVSEQIEKILDNQQKQ